VECFLLRGFASSTHDTDQTSSEVGVGVLGEGMCVELVNCYRELEC